MANYHDGVSYMRTTRMDTPVIYDATEKFNIGGCKIICQSDSDIAVVIGAGVTLHEAIKAHERLHRDGLSIAVIDLYSIKPFDYQTVLSVAKESNNTIIVVEDHYMQGGMGEMIMAAFCADGMRIIHLGVDQLPRSGKPEELLALCKIDADAIVEVVKNLQ
jgi:transketolase